MMYLLDTCACVIRQRGHSHALHQAKRHRASQGEGKDSLLDLHKIFANSRLSRIPCTSSMYVTIEMEKGMASIIKSTAF